MRFDALKSEEQKALALHRMREGATGDDPNYGAGLNLRLYAGSQSERDRPMHGIGSDQMQSRSENPLLAQCKFRAVTYSKARSGTPFAAPRNPPIAAGIKDLGNLPWSGVERQRSR
jgi:hypothetical protein